MQGFGDEEIALTQTKSRLEFLCKPHMYRADTTATSAPQHPLWTRTEALKPPHLLVDAALRLASIGALRGLQGLVRSARPC